MIDYFAVIHKHIAPTSLVYRYYVPHVVLVTHKALALARRLDVSPQELQFIEEAAMLHDIGIIRVKAEEIGCWGELPYICHGTEGRRILEAEGLPQHALVAERHTGVGISRADIIEHQYPLPQRDMLADSLAEQIISWADLFYGKNPKKLWQKRTMKTVRKDIARYGEEKVARLAQWQAQFGPKGKK